MFELVKLDDGEEEEEEERPDEEKLDRMSILDAISQCEPFRLTIR